MTAQTYIAVVITVFVMTISFAIYMALRGEIFSNAVKMAQKNIIIKLQYKIPADKLDETVDIISEELKPIMKGSFYHYERECASRAGNRKEDGKSR